VSVKLTFTFVGQEPVQLRPGEGGAFAGTTSVVEGRMTVSNIRPGRQ
jgi:hypothetical protein